MRSLTQSQIGSLLRFGLLLLLAGRPGVSAAQDLADFQLHPSLEISLFASEPDIVDPVALTFDEFGRAYVVEMRDYPYGFGPQRHPSGTIRRLEDRDGNGRVDLSVVFAENLSFPTSIMAWNGGVLVTAPPAIIFLKDTDNDGVADHRETVLEGFELGVTDSNVNGLRWGLDNWIHGVNGGNGGSVRFAGKGGAPLRLGNRDFRFRPGALQVELTTHTGGGFGLVFDDWGRSFTTYNINHIQERVADADLFLRFPGLPSVQTTHSISDHSDMARIFPLSAAVTRPNHPEQAGYFSAAGGMGRIGHGGWPADLVGGVLVCDVVGNLVHRDLLVPHGAVFTATRAAREQASEFLACRDPLFRPVGVEAGPDGALYLIDMQRDVIEHPDYIPAGKRKTLDLRAGQNRGRIYRLAPKGWASERELPGAASAQGRVALLGAPNPWTRFTAQRLLVTSREVSVAQSLGRMFRESENSLARLHALWTLEGLGRLEEATLMLGLKDPHPGVRENAVKLVRERPAQARFLEGVLTLLRDTDGMVRFQAALSLGHVAGEKSVASDVADLLKRDCRDAWMRRAALSSLRREESAVLESLLTDRRFREGEGEAERAAVREVASLVGARIAPSDSTTLSRLLDWAVEKELGEAVQVALLTGVREGLGRGSGKVAASQEIRARLGILLKGKSRPVMTAAWRLQRALGLSPEQFQIDSLTSAIRDASDRALEISARLDAVELLGLGESAVVVPAALRLLDGLEPSALQRAALDLLRNHREPEVGRGLVAAWPSLSPAWRPAVVNLLVYRPSFHAALLDALEEGTLQLGELNLDLEHRRELLRESGPDIRERAAKLMTDDEYSNRGAVVEKWLGQMPAQGNAEGGRLVFERVCAQCHVAHGLGSSVGPELSGMSHRSVEDLLSNILDPNMAMNPAYVAFTAELKDDEEETGILSGETGESITLLQALGRKVEIRRSELLGLRANNRSLMPEGLEAGLSAQDLRDLIAFLQVGR